jgi:O-methyltransferase involved in polyketide biosynthesis
MTASKRAARRLSAVPSTLRIPLAARASGDAMFPQMAVRDAYAASILEKIRDEGHPLPEDRTTIYSILSRTRRFRSLAQEFLKQHPGGRVVNMGCGLSHYFQWLDDGRSRMTDAATMRASSTSHRRAGGTRSNCRASARHSRSSSSPKAF